MAGVRKIDQAEWDQQDKKTGSCPKLHKAQSWMHVDVNKPMTCTNKQATRKVTARERATYTACEEAFASGAIYSWSIDQKTGLWLVQMAEGSAWLELTMAEVAVHLGVAGTAPKVAKVRAPRATEVIARGGPGSLPSERAFVAEVPTVPVAALEQVEETKVTETQIRALPAEVEEYLARLVFAAKREYAAALASYLVGAGPAPADPGTEWSAKVQAKLARLVKS